MDQIENLEAMLAAGRDNATLRYGLGTAYHKRGRLERAIEHLLKAIELDPGFSAAFKALGRALAESGRTDDAVEAYRQGVKVAEQRGDVQAAKEMKVYLRRLALPLRDG